MRHQHTTPPLHFSFFFLPFSTKCITLDKERRMKREENIEDVEDIFKYPALYLNTSALN